jgi:hypothetical protein
VPADDGRERSDSASQAPPLVTSSLFASVFAVRVGGAPLESTAALPLVQTLVMTRQFSDGSGGDPAEEAPAMPPPLPSTVLYK